MTTTQPSDEWSFLPNDEELETDEATQARETAAEMAAMHIESEATGSRTYAGPNRAEDRARSFDDTEPEVGEAPLPPSDDHELDLEELLESQHYSFAAEDEG